MNFSFKLLYILLIINLKMGYAQYTYNIPDNDIIKLSNRITKLYKKSKCYNKSDSIRHFHIHLVGFKGELKKNDFLNKNFLNKIIPLYNEYNRFLLRKKRVLKSSTYLYDQKSQKIRASTNNRWINCMHTGKGLIYLYAKRLVKKLSKMQDPFIFYLGGTSVDYKFIVDDEGEIIVTYSNKEDLQFLSIEEFIENHWERFIE